MLCAVDYIFNLLCAFNCLQPMKKFVFSVASRATGRLQIKPSGSGDENELMCMSQDARETKVYPEDRAEQRLRMCRDGRGLGSKLVSFAKGFSKHPHILAFFKVESEYLRFPFKVKVDYFILYSILVYSLVFFLLFFSMNKRSRTFKVSPLN